MFVEGVVLRVLTDRADLVVDDVDIVVVLRLLNASSRLLWNFVGGHRLLSVGTWVVPTLGLAVSWGLPVAVQLAPGLALLRALAISLELTEVSVLWRVVAISQLLDVVLGVG